MIYRFFLISCCLVFLGNMSFHIYVHIKCCNFFRLKTIFFAGNCYVQKYTYIFCERKLKYQMLSNPEAMKKLDEKIYIQRIRKGNEIYLLAVQRDSVVLYSVLVLKSDYTLVDQSQYFSFELSQIHHKSYQRMIFRCGSY